MSFSSTPLGQGRRLDHHAFLGLSKPQPRDNRPQNPSHRRVGPASYSYGASTLATRAQAKQERPAPAPAPAPETPQAEQHSDDPDDTALVRFARLKQRELAQQTPANKPHHPSPHPERWAVKDTSVNIASAFIQAANSADEMAQQSTSDARANGARRQAPNGAGLEFEKETVMAQRRAAPPPSRSGARGASRPMPRTESANVVPDSEGEQEYSKDAEAGPKSPLKKLVDAGKRFAPVSFLARQRSPQPEQSYSHTNGNGAAHESSSYDYSAEEREYQATTAMAAQKPSSRRAAAAPKRGRISLDNQAYRPSESEYEESDEDLVDDPGSRSRRKMKKANGAAGGPPLTSLPVTSYDKRKKRRRSNGKTIGDLHESSESSNEQDTSGEFGEKHSQLDIPPSQLPQAHITSVTPKPEQDSRDEIYLGGDSTMAVEHHLRQIDETTLDIPIDDIDMPPRSRFSIGAALGRPINAVFRLIWLLIQLVVGCLSLLTRWSGTILGAFIEVLFKQPARWLKRIDFRLLARLLIFGLTIYSAWYVLESGLVDLGDFPSLPFAKTTYRPPEIPVSNLGELADRLQRLEVALARISTDNERSRSWIEGTRSEIVGRVGSLESQVHRESIRAIDAESKFRATTNDALQAVKHEVASLQSELRFIKDEEQNRVMPTNDEEARAKLHALEERFGGIESGVREALEMGKNALKAGASSVSAPAWWQKLTSGQTDSALTIKSADGQDVTSLLQQLVDSRVDSKISFLPGDTLAKHDFALYSSGAYVIPSLTSSTYELPTNRWTGWLWGKVIGNNDGAIGRPPVTALHHDIENGHCWPFPGTEGHLGVVLSAPVYISDVTIDHVARARTSDIRSAPRQMELWGLVEGQDNIVKLANWRAHQAAAREDAELAGRPFVELEPPYPALLPKSPEYIRIANFTYNVHSSQNIQSFPVHDHIRDLGIDFGVVVLFVKNNWGREDYTCLYRLRVHGLQLGGTPEPYPEEYAYQ
ncbi:hypothetical protein WOLCODRAFT_163795 [Wolfiporia cocos MD-104 SS10]|uniref:SUN domain-containing protein n=1 Tax=Wolfiporia cocos (strain MD-104) TaxID=742152 RepID=A0A2H3JLQ4_WOLCO|nr:hypothetical protein WOLCODRAFT_163795 [Wolfiporia cocos MD-104 SS10]